LPRLRIDQLMDLAWKVLLPASFVSLILTGVLQMFGFLWFGIGIGLTLIVALVLLSAYRARLQTRGQIQLVSVPRAMEPAAAG
jgi:hypothetical protein